MLAEISVAKKDALVRLVESESAPNELKQRALKIANAEDEAFALKQEISEVKMAMTHEKLSYNEKIAALKMDYENRLRKLQDEMDSKSKMWTTVAGVEDQLKATRRELIASQEAASELSKVNKRMLEQLGSANMQTLHFESGKVKSIRRLEALEAAVERRSHSRYELHDAQQGTTSEDIEYSRDEEDESEVVALRKELQAEQHRRADYARPGSQTARRTLAERCQEA